MRAYSLFSLLAVACSTPGNIPIDAASDSGIDTRADGANDAFVSDVGQDVSDASRSDISTPSDAARSDSADAASVDAGACQYPVVWTPEPGRQAAVQAALHATAPNATMTWVAALGTPSIIQRIGLSFACNDDEDYWLPLRTLLLANQAVFQMNPDEWAHTPVPCRTFTETARSLTFGRNTMGAQPISRDVVNFYFRRVDANTIEIASFVGTYVPHDTDVAARLARCARVSDVDLEANVRSASYPYLVYRSSIACQVSSRGSYSPNSADSVLVLPQSHASWFTRADGVVFSRYLEVELHMDASNVTDDIRSSDARCPDGTGWVVRFDEVTGVAISVRAGIGCVVC